MNEKMKEIWQKHNITECVCEFDCGGDNMGNTEFVLHDKNGTINYQDDNELSDLVNYLDNEMYKVVHFYVNSDGHYQGESGKVIITLGDDEFQFIKDAMAMFNESTINIIELELTDEEVEFISKYVGNINGGIDDNPNFNYKIDFVMTDEKEKLINDLSKKIDDFTQSYSPDDIEGELDEWYSFSTNQHELSELTINVKDNLLKIEIVNQYMELRESD